MSSSMQPRINYDRLTDGVLADSDGTLLLHCCCAPCATAAAMRILSVGVRPTLFFYNPNITDGGEFERRLEAMRRFAAHVSLPLIVPPYNPAEFLEVAAEFKTEPEGGVRCSRCFSLRLGYTAEYADTHGFSLFGTTLTVGPRKCAETVNAAGYAASGHAAFLPADFKKRGGYARSVELSRLLGLYRQDFCGCAYSVRSGKTEGAV